MDRISTVRFMTYCSFNLPKYMGKFVSGERIRVRKSYPFIETAGTMSMWGNCRISLLNFKSIPRYESCHYKAEKFYF